jgi:hypothetical protein
MTGGGGGVFKSASIGPPGGSIGSSMSGVML